MGLEYSYIGALLVGLLGGVHCVGMCGGVVGALTLGLAPQQQGKGYRLLLLLLYNLGRLTSYTLAGALVGGIGQLAANMVLLHQAQLILQLLAGGFMLLLGLYLGGWWLGLNRVERAGGALWRLIEPHAKRLLPVRDGPGAFALGLAWGWLPCGLVYTVLIWSIASGSALEGGLLMLSFGLGTLPNLLAMGLFATVLQRWVRRPAVRRTAGALVIGFALLTLWRAAASI